MNRACLGLFWAVVGLFSASWFAQATERTPANLNAEIGLVISWPTKTLTGAGTDANRARVHAYEKASQIVKQYLTLQKPPLQWWSPSDGYLVKNLLEFEKLGKDKLIQKDQVYKTWDVRLKPLDAKMLAQFREFDERARQRVLQQKRELRIEQRTILVAKIVVAALIAMVGVWGYARLKK